MEAETDHWKQALHQSIALFVEEELKPYFGELVSFIRMVEIAGGVSKVQLGKLPFVNILTRKGIAHFLLLNGQHTNISVIFTLCLVKLDHFERASYGFSNTWRQSLLSINTSVIQHFSSFKNGTLVLHQVLGQLIVYYTRFHSLLDEKLQELGGASVGQAGGGGGNGQNTAVATSTRGWSHQPVGIQTVMVEVKKFRSNFLP